MKNSLLTAFNPSLVWWCVSFKSCCYTNLGVPAPVARARPAGLNNYHVKKPGNFPNDAWFLKAKWLGLKGHCKIHWIGTVKNISGDTAVTNWKLSKNDCNPGLGDGIYSVQKSTFWCDNFGKKRTKVFATNDFLKNINHKNWLVLARLELINAKVISCPW